MAPPLQYSLGIEVVFMKLFITLSLLVFSGWVNAETPKPKDPSYKLLHMYELFYLPFNIEFKQGKTYNDIFPLIADKKGEFTQLLSPDQLKLLDQEYSSERKTWAKSSLFLNTALAPNESQRITQRLVTHRISLKRTAWDAVSVSDQIKVKALLDGKPDLVKKAVTQYQFLRSFLKEPEEEKFNFFVIGPSWCESSKEYRYILEYLSKKFPNNQLVIHSVVIDDPEEQIFDAQILKDLFPFPENYSHDSVPRFLALQKDKDKLKVWEEGEALVELKSRFFAQHQGFLNNTLPAMRKIAGPGRFLATTGN